MPTGQWNPRGVPWLPSGDALHHLCPPASLYSVHVKPFNPHTHTPTHTCTHTPHLQGRVPAVTLPWHLRPSHPLVPLPSPWYIPDCPIQGQPPVFQCFLSKGWRAIPLLPSSTHILEQQSSPPLCLWQPEFFFFFKNFI